MAENQTLDTTEISFADLRSELKKPASAQVEPVTEPEVKEPVTEPEVKEAEPETTEPEVKEAEPVEEKPKKAEQRFSKLTQRAKEAEARAEALAAEIAALRATKTDAPKAAEPVQTESKKPTPPDATTWTGTWEELESARMKYVEELAEYKAYTVLAKRDAEAQQARLKAQAEKVHQSWQQQIDAAIETHEEMEDAIKSVGAVVSRMGIQDVIKESSVGAEIVLALHADKSALENLSKLSIASAAREIGRIEAGILGKTTPAATKAAKNLPAPPKIVGGTASSDSSPLDLNKADMSTFRSHVRKALGKR